MKVLLSAGMIQEGKSGVARYVIALSEALVRGQSEKIELFVTGLDSDRTLFPWISNDRWVSIPSNKAGGMANLLWHQTELNQLLRDLKIEVLHIPSYRRMLACSAVPQVATIHDCAPFISRGKYDYARGFFGRVVVPKIARRVPQIIAVSATTGKDVVKFMKVPSSRVTVIPNGIDHETFRPRSAEDVATFKKRKNLDTPYFLYVARLEHPAKNHIRLIRAFEKLAESSVFTGSLILLGALWHGSEVIEKAVETSSFRERIRLEGFVGNDDLPLWYAAAEALIFPSLMEGFGLPLLEAQACGTRIACANSTSLPEVAGPSGILFNGLDEASITEAMTQLASMSATERKQRQDTGYRWAERFTWSAHAAQAVLIYQKALIQKA